MVESCSVEALFAGPAHPYTRGLLASIPPVGAARGTALRPARLPTIEGSVPSLLAPPPGCRFEPRCASRRDVCREAEPALREVASERLARCLFAEEVMGNAPRSALR